MIGFEWPWVFAALPLPLLVRWLLSPAGAAGEASLSVPFASEFRPVAGAGSAWRGGRLAAWLAALAWLLLVTAAARPTWTGETVQLPVSGRDLLLAVDISGSMDKRDFQLRNRVVDRLTALKAVAGRFVERREGDRLGLILFGRQAYLQTPLTFDRATVGTLLAEAEVGLAGRETAIGDAIGLAIKRLRQRDEGDRVLILLTDGTNTAGEVDPLKAADLAAAEGLTIYTIGIGSDARRAPSFFGLSRLTPSAQLDEATLTAIADTTGGRYFRARSTRELEEIYREIDALEPVEQEGQGFRPVRSLFAWPLAAALMLALGTLLARTGLRLTARRARAAHAAPSGGVSA